MKIKVWLRVSGTFNRIEDEIEIPDFDDTENEEPDMKSVMMGEYLRAWVDEMITYGLEVPKQ